MKWETVRLGDLYEIHNGLSKGGKFFGSGYPFLSFSTVFNHFFIPDELSDYVQSTEAERKNYSIRRGDIFITRTSETSDELGMSCVALKDYPDATYNGFTKRMRPITNRVLPEYIGYYMRTPVFRAKISVFSSIITRASLKNGDLLRLTVELPNLQTQNKIASILSSYDNLIENNQKRIKLLEQMAQRLYQEWFVRFRFPGYEKAKFVDGVPKGWRISTIGKLCTLKHQTVSPSNLSTSVPYIGLEHMPRNDFCLSTWGDSSNINSSKYVYHAGNIIFGVIRPYFHKVGFAINDGIVSSDSFVLEPIRAYWGLFLLTVSSNAFVEVISQTCKSGTKMPRADWKQMEKYPVPIAPDEIHNAFENIIGKITQEIKALAFQNKNLAKQRDLLLPRLMSGKLAV